MKNEILPMEDHLKNIIRIIEDSNDSNEAFINVKEYCFRETTRNPHRDMMWVYVIRNYDLREYIDDSYFVQKKLKTILI